jgi:hypothetical protein
MNKYEIAISDLELFKKFSCEHPGTATIDLALTALREKLEREKGCEYCKGSAFNHVGAMKIFGYSKVFTRGADAPVDEKDRFKFCPMCGKPLPKAPEASHEAIT